MASAAGAGVEEGGGEEEVPEATENAGGDNEETLRAQPLEAEGGEVSHSNEEDEEEPWSDTEIELPWEADNCSGSPESPMGADCNPQIR